MKQHPFLLAPGIWLGEGNIQLNMVSEELGFVTRWNVNNKDPGGKIVCCQEIQVKGLSEVMHNEFSLSDLNGGEFMMDLANQALGKITGKGLVNEKIIAWEFRISEIGFEGFEMYELQEDNTYLMRAEYVSSDQFRTHIKGRIWQKTS